MKDHRNYTPAVENLQRYLRQLALAQGIMPAPPVDGIFESVTEDALRSFQERRGLPITGIADLTTWELLYADYRASLAYHSPPRQISLFPFDPPQFAYAEESRGFPIAALQYMLRELERNYEELAGVEITGLYDENTQSAVRAFQKKNRLPSNGKTDATTWNAVTDQFNTLVARVGDE